MNQPSPQILFATAFPRDILAELGPGFAAIGPFDPPLQDHLGAEAQTIRALVTIGTLKTHVELMDRLPRLGLICCFGSGYEGVDIAAARQRGIMVTHSPAVNAGAVAEFALALLLASTRHILSGDKFVRDGAWKQQIPVRMRLARGLEGRKIGIYGYGAIGAKIAERAASFGTEIAYHGRSERADIPYPYHPSLLSLAEWADVLMVAVRAAEGNRHAVDAQVMRALGPEGILINIARGSVVDEAALVALLQSGELGSAGLDVFEHEPRVPAALLALPQVVLSPHLGGATFGAFEAMQDLVVANLRAYFESGTVLTPIPELA
jgi:glyoxylate reductase